MRVAVGMPLKAGLRGIVAIHSWACSLRLRSKHERQTPRKAEERQRGRCGEDRQREDREVGSEGTRWWRWGGQKRTE